MTTQHIRLAAAPLLAASLFLVGCAGTTSDSAKGPGAGQAPSETPTPMDPQEKEYYLCLEKHGVVLDKEGGRLRVDKDNYDAKAEKKAQEQCADLLPAREEREAAAKRDAQRMADCMREQGVKDYPDPDPETGEVEFTREMKSDPAFKHASVVCVEHADG
ncbi:hypothetical protein ACH492_34440 [Streptomyces sp. NPDC019443]|uniref:hypothetical protein n=1 Tax=Streptomyces sp. NPDC019443 TaxID=3365061 RepID=UPI0037AB68AB